MTTSALTVPSSSKRRSIFSTTVSSKPDACPPPRHQVRKVSRVANPDSCSSAFILSILSLKAQEWTESIASMFGGGNHNKNNIDTLIAASMSQCELHIAQTDSFSLKRSLKVSRASNYRKIFPVRYTATVEAKDTTTVPDLSTTNFVCNDNSNSVALRFNKRSPSILRTKFDLSAVQSQLASQKATTNEDNDDAPSLASTASINSSSLEFSVKKSVSFDPRIWVREFVRDSEERSCTWFTHEEMHYFRLQAMERIRRAQRAVYAGTATPKIMFSHQALQPGSDEEEEYCLIPSQEQQVAIDSHLRNILVVDPHELCRSLFQKTLLKAFPNAKVTLVSTSQDAMTLVQQDKQDFDLVVVEERLGGCKGSALIGKLSLLLPQALMIGVSFNLSQDHVAFSTRGADMCWTKPPPPIDNGLKLEMLQKKLSKEQQQKRLVVVVT